MGCFEPSDDSLAVTLLLLPGASMLTFASTVEPMRAANRVAGAELFDWRLVSAEGAPVMTSCGIPIAVQGALDPAAITGMLLVVAGFHAREQAGRELTRRLGRAAKRAELVVGVDAGPWLMARAGLLHGRRATTHWEDLEDFSTRYPAVAVQPDRYVVDGAVATAGGASPIFDFMLHLIRRRFGYTIALDVASVFGYDEAHAGTEAQPLAPLARLSRHEPRVAEAIRHMEASLDAPLNVAAIAAALEMSTRTLEKLFRDTVGTSPGRFFLNLRLNAARRLVVDTRLAMTEVAVRTGFTSASSFARAFRRGFGTSAVAMRRDTQRG
jgi:transcriptional regulator GlxA family with amidase domain